MKVYFAHRARNGFEREPSEREGPNFSKASSIECNERDHSNLLRASSNRDYRARFAIFNLQCRAYGNLWKYASVMLEQCLYFQCIYIGL